MWGHTFRYVDSDPFSRVLGGEFLAGMVCTGVPSPGGGGVFCVFFSKIYSVFSYFQKLHDHVWFRLSYIMVFSKD